VAFVLDFVNDTEEIVDSFQPYFKSTELSGETEPDKLYELQSEIEAFNLFDYDQVDAFCIEFFKKTDTDEALQPILNAVLEKWKALDEDKQRDEFKSMIQSFCRMYSYISQLMTFNEETWEKLFIFLKYLNKFLPKGLSERVNLSDAIDLSSLRIQLIGDSNLSLSDDEGVLDPVSDTAGGSKGDEDLELLSEIIKRVNETFGIELKEEDLVDLRNIQKRINTNEQLGKVMIGNNSENDKKKEFENMLKSEVSGFYGDKIDFFKKVMKKEVFPLIMDAMFTEFRKQQNL
jgi:type I restriction enzyme R subunit